MHSAEPAQQRALNGIASAVSTSRWGVVHNRSVYDLRALGVLSITQRTLNRAVDKDIGWTG